MMKIRQIFHKWMLQEDLNFLLTNRIPRITLTRFMGWWSQIRHPWVVKSSMAVWRMFSDLDLSDAKHQKFDSLHDCFTRELLPGARVVNPDPAFMTSPCDAIVGACGTISQGQVFQAKGFPYQLQTLLGTSERCQHWPSTLEGGSYLTLRLTSSMYHRFHAPDQVHLQHVTYISGDTWNVNPVARTRVVLQKRKGGFAHDNARGSALFGGACGGRSGGQHAAARGRCAAEPALQRPKRAAL